MVVPQLWSPSVHFETVTLTLPVAESLEASAHLTVIVRMRAAPLVRRSPGIQRKVTGDRSVARHGLVAGDADDAAMRCGIDPNRRCLCVGRPL